MDHEEYQTQIDGLDIWVAIDEVSRDLDKSVSNNWKDYDFLMEVYIGLYRKLYNLPNAVQTPA